MHQFGYQQPIPKNLTNIEADQKLHKRDLQGWGLTDYHWLHANHLAIWSMRYHLVQIGEVAYEVAHGHATHTQENKEWYKNISRIYLTLVGLIHAAALALSCFTHSASLSMSSQRRRCIRTDVPGRCHTFSMVVHWHYMTRVWVQVCKLPKDLAMLMIYLSGKILVTQLIYHLGGTRQGRGDHAHVVRGVIFSNLDSLKSLFKF
ncbi:hypothetical protein O6P43_030291 [Quillaja saponaria]|uniref:Uncharacterized protein n=1 Tax=Quillaja saponaria TaxID=32244 RepID=A0AAD7KSG7_QUISA|nr:hypothetical protein O6P43_030291 [Quillaja saponaria]